MWAVKNNAVWTLHHHATSVHAATWLDNRFTIDISKAKVEMFHQVGVSHDHVKDISSSGFHLTLDQDALTVWHHHIQLPLSGWRLPFLWLRENWEGDFKRRCQSMQLKKKMKVGNKEKQAGFCQERTTMEPGSSNTTCGSSSILINSGPMSCNRGQGKRECNFNSSVASLDETWDGILHYHYIIKWIIYLIVARAHLHFLVIQTHCGLKLWAGVPIAIHVRTAGAAVQLLPAAITLSVPMSWGNPGNKYRFHILSLTGSWICCSWQSGSNKHHAF